MGDEEACGIDLAEPTPSNYKCHFCVRWAQNQTKAGGLADPFLGPPKLGSRGSVHMAQQE